MIKGDKMRVSNWTECPKCKQIAEAEGAKREMDDEEVQISRKPNKHRGSCLEDFLAEEGSLEEKSDEPVESNETLRETYEIGIFEGVFETVYQARCTECGFSFEFNHNVGV